VSATSTDRIVKTVQLKAPRSRVWRAISDFKEFGAWFRSEFDGPFVPGAHLKARCQYPGYEYIVFEVWIERVEPERLLSFRWHPCPIEKGKDYSGEPTTLVEFVLEDVAGGTRLTVTESGFDKIPLARRAEALKGNEGGWEEQVVAIEKWLKEKA